MVANSRRGYTAQIGIGGAFFGRAAEHIFR